MRRDLTGRHGLLSNYVLVTTSLGNDILNPRITIPPASPPPQTTQRTRNQQIAKADPQAVFRGDCAKCHAEPTKGKLGKPLYQAACAICHEAEHRASMVPDLTKIPLPKYPQRWQQLIATGKPGTLMPAFCQGHGGPLTAEQVRSLVKFMSNEFPLRKVSNKLQP